MLDLQNEINIFSLAKRINRPLILDGAMGSLLQQKGIKAEGKLWMSFANISKPDIVSKIHNEYIKAGADIITTNTFRTNPLAVNNTRGISFKQLVKASVNIAKEAKGNLPVIIAGSNAPAEDCYQRERTISKKELELNHKAHIDELVKNGCNFILNETQSHFDEIKIISEYCDRNKVPYVISLFFDSTLKILSGEKLTEVVKYLNDSGSLAISFNCILPSVMNKIKNILSSKSNWGFYLNCGDGAYTDTNIKCGISPKSYSEEIKKYLSYSPSFIGACCGSSPLHIKEIKKMLDGRANS